MNAFSLNHSDADSKELEMGKRKEIMCSLVVIILVANALFLPVEPKSSPRRHFTARA